MSGEDGRRSASGHANKIVSGDFAAGGTLDFFCNPAARPDDAVAKLRHIPRCDTNLPRKFVASGAGFRKPLCQSHRPRILAQLNFSQPKNIPGDFRVALWRKVNGLEYLHPVAKKAKVKKVTHFLREWRLFRGVTQERLAGRTDYSTGLISQLESGETKFTEESLGALAAALQCEPGDLLSRDPNSPDYELWRIIQGVPADERSRVIRVVEAMLRKTA